MLIPVRVPSRHPSTRNKLSYSGTQIDHTTRRLTPQPLVSARYLNPLTLDLFYGFYIFQGFKTVLNRESKPKWRLHHLLDRDWHWTSQ